MTDFMTRDKMNPGIRPVLMLMVGCSRTGKSTYARRWREEHPDWVIVRRDDFRRAMNVEWSPPLEPFIKAAHLAAVCALLLAGHNVIVDETLLTRAQRRPWLELDVPCEKRIALINEPQDEEAWRRVCARDCFDWGVIMRQVARFEDVTLDETDGYGVMFMRLQNMIDTNGEPKWLHGELTP